MSSLSITQDQAIEIADAFLINHERLRMEKLDEMMKSGKIKTSKPTQYVYTLKQINDLSDTWYLTYWWETSDGVLVDPSFTYVSVHKTTGEAKSGYF
ncbi:MAG: hypothetical protein ACOYL5_01375 [Phototrophicaceae bacterium]|jgi:hypothetical protein